MAAPGDLIVTVPDGVVEGQSINITTTTGLKFKITVPPGVTAGQKIKVVVPHDVPPVAAKLAGPTSQPQASKSAPAAQASKSAPAAQAEVTEAEGEEEAPPMARVFETEELLVLILWHAHALAPCHAEYSELVGYHSADAADWTDRSKRGSEEMWLNAAARRFFANRRKIRQAALLVCTAWHDLNTSERGREAWATRERASLESRLTANRRAAAEPSLPWLYRLCAMSAIDDVAGLQAAIGDKPPRPSRSLGPAPAWGHHGMRAAVRMLSDAEEGDDEEEEVACAFEVPVEPLYGLEPFAGGRDAHVMHPEIGETALRREIRTRTPSARRHQRLRELVSALFAHPTRGYCSLDTGDISQHGQWESAVLCVCVLNAAMAGAADAVSFLLSLDSGIWYYGFNQKGDRAIGHAVEYACEHACLEQPVAGIRALIGLPPPKSDSHEARLSAHVREETLHARIRGASGNALHLAAGRGHVSLVRALLAAGMKPNKLDDASYASRNGEPRRPGATALAWARARGHNEVVRLIDASRGAQGAPLLRLPSPGGFSSVQLGTLHKFVVRGDSSFGFIEPDEEYDDGGEDVFVHIETLRAAARGAGGRGYPAPGQRLAYVAGQGRKGRRANRVADGEDGGTLDLSLNEFEAPDEWAEYNDELNYL